MKKLLSSDEGSLYSAENEENNNEVAVKVLALIYLQIRHTTVHVQVRT